MFSFLTDYVYLMKQTFYAILRYICNICKASPSLHYEHSFQFRENKFKGEERLGLGEIVSGVLLVFLLIFRASLLPFCIILATQLHPSCNKAAFSRNNYWTFYSSYNLVLRLRIVFYLFCEINEFSFHIFSSSLHHCDFESVGTRTACLLVNQSMDTGYL